MSETTAFPMCIHHRASHLCEECRVPSGQVFATPTTPDRAAVREADVLSHLYQALDGSPDYTKANLKHVLGLPSNCDSHAIVDALLAAVSRPAEARGEPDMSPRLLAINLADAAPVTTRGAADRVVLHYRQLCALKPERYEVFLAGKGYSHKLSDAVAYLQDAAPRPEPGEPSEAMVEAMAKAAAMKNAEVAGAPWSQMDVDENWPDIREEWVQTLRAALAAREGA